MPGGPGQRPGEEFTRPYPYGQSQQQQQSTQAGLAPNSHDTFWSHGSAQQPHPFGPSDPFSSMGFPPMRSMFSDPSASSVRQDPFDDPFFRQSFGGGLFGGLLGSFFQGMSAFPQLQPSFHHQQQQFQQQQQQQQQHHQQQQQQWQWQQHPQQEAPSPAPPPLSVQEVDPNSPDAAFGTTGEFIVEHPDSDSDEDSDVEEVQRPTVSDAAGARTSSGQYQDFQQHRGQQQTYQQQQQPHQQPYQQQQLQQQQSIVTTDHPFPGLGTLFGGGGYSSSFSFQSSCVSHSGIGGTQYYTESSSRRVGPGGVVEEQHSQRDSSGMESMRLSRGIDDKGRTITRTRQGQEQTSTEILHNITPEEARTFDATWQRRARGDFLDAEPGQGQDLGQLPYGAPSSGRPTPGA